MFVYEADATGRVVGGCVAKPTGTLTHLLTHDSWSVVYGHVGDMSTLISEARGGSETSGLFHQMLGIAKRNTADVPSALR